MKGNTIVFFDGLCNFCNYWVNFSIRRDRQRKLKFAPLQGETAKAVLPTMKINPLANESVIVIENGKVYKDSAAALRIAKNLGGGWKLFYGFIIIPRIIRDGIYKWIARNRYKWYGKKNQCMIPPPEVRDRFLD